VDPVINRKAGPGRRSCPPDIALQIADHLGDELDRCAALFGGHAERWRRQYRPGRGEE
jgi:hypothetical protein